jgi:carbamoyl-phosphate synthase large subunit
MPLRNDLEKILLIGSGPNVIGQGSEFDYFICSALKAARESGIETAVVNSNPATLSTDADKADATYIEPLDVRHVAAIIARENPTAIMPLFGGQKALNLCSELSKSGILERYDVKIIGATSDMVELTENRISFKKLMLELGLDMAKSSSASNVEESEGIAKYLGYPVVVRPAFTTGGFGGGLVYNVEELRDVVSRGISASMVRSVLIEEAVLGWKELEVEVLRDNSGNSVVAGIVENVDPMGVHTGDSLSVFPPLTLAVSTIDRINAASIKISEKLNVSGSVNIQFAYQPEGDRLIVVEVNLRASRTTALIGKAKGLPLAYYAAKLALGYDIDELGADIKNKISALPQYVTVKMPCWSMEKFKGSLDKLGPQMKSVGEAMAIGSDFKEAFNKVLISLGISDPYEGEMLTIEEIYSLLRSPSSKRYLNIYSALMKGASIENVSALTGVDKFYVNEINAITDLRKELAQSSLSSKGIETLIKQGKKAGFSDKFIAKLLNSDESVIRKFRIDKGIIPAFINAGNENSEFSTYGKSGSIKTGEGRKAVILGSGPSRIGQGTEFDYGVVHAADRLRQAGYTTIIINNPPSASSTDSYSGNRIYIEPITLESVLSVIDREKPEFVVASFGGHTAYLLASEFESRGIKVLGFDKDIASLTENKGEFKQFLTALDIDMPRSGIADDVEAAIKIASGIGYPVIVRPMYVMGGKGMEIIHEDESLRAYMLRSAGMRISIEKFLTDAVEAEVDAIAAGNSIYIPAIMEHIEYAGIHSGDSDCVIPASEKLNKALIIEATTKLVKALKVRGLINVKYAVMNNRLYLMEARMRSSRSVPLLTKVTGADLASIAVEAMLGDALTAEKKLQAYKIKPVNYCAVKAAVFPFDMFPEADPVLGPEMRSTGSVLGIGDSVGEAYNKAQAATDTPIPTSGTVMISVDDSRKKMLDGFVSDFIKLGFRIIATSGTYNYLTAKGIKVDKIDKMYEGRPNVADAMINGSVDFLINPPSGIKSEYDDSYMRKIAIKHRICYITTMEAVKAAISGIKEERNGACRVRSLQSYYRG